MIKQLKFFLIIIFSLFLISCRPDAYDTQGNAIRMADYKGKWVVINYWAPWCKPCLTELPELNMLYVLNKNKIIVLGVSFDGLSKKEINTFANKLGITFPVLTSFPIRKYNIAEINTLPVTFLISPEGQLVEILDGPQSRHAIEDEIKKLTNKLPPTTKK